MRYTYGMRARGFSPLCQPKEGFLERWDSPYAEYYDLLEYNRKLTPEEERDYELDYLGEEEEDAVCAYCPYDHHGDRVRCPHYLPRCDR